MQGTLSEWNNWILTNEVSQNPAAESSPPQEDEPAEQDVVETVPADEPVLQAAEQPEIDEDLQSSCLMAALWTPFADEPWRFWEKTAAFWGIGATGMAGAYLALTMGNHPGPFLASGAASGLCAGYLALRAMPENRPRRGWLPLVLPAALASMTVTGLLLYFFHLLLFVPSTSCLLFVSTLCCFAGYCSAAFVAPIGGFVSPVGWPAAVAKAALNAHRAAGAAVLAFFYLLLATPAAAMMAALPPRLLTVFDQLVEKRQWSWLWPLTAVVRMKAAQQPDQEEVHGIRIFTHWLAEFCQSLPVLVTGSWYAIFAADAYVLAQLGSVRLVTARKE